MPNATPIFRNPGLMNAHDAALIVIDVQEKLIPLVQQSEIVEWNIGRLIETAKILAVNTFVTEQYPKGLGNTVKSIIDRLKDGGEPNIATKTMFSCRACTSMIDELKSSGISKLLLVGIEAHVCVAQSAMDFIASGFEVSIAVDAVSSRHVIDYETALRRLENCGAIPTTTEAAMFEWCVDSNRPEFKSISQLVRGSGPTK